MYALVPITALFQPYTYDIKCSMEQSKNMDK